MQNVEEMWPAYAERLLVSGHHTWRVEAALWGTTGFPDMRQYSTIIIIIICMYRTCAYSRSIFAESVLPSMKWRQLVILSLVEDGKVLLPLIKCCSQSTEWSWAACALGLVPPAWPWSPCRTWSISTHLLCPESHLRKACVFLCSA